MSEETRAVIHTTIYTYIYKIYIYKFYIYICNETPSCFQCLLLSIYLIYIRIFLYIFFLSGHYLPLLLLLYVYLSYSLCLYYIHTYYIYTIYIFIDWLYTHTIMLLWYITVYFNIPTWSVSVCLNWSMVVVSHDCRSCRVVMLAIYDYVDLFRLIIHRSIRIRNKDRPLRL